MFLGPVVRDPSSFDKIRQKHWALQLLLATAAILMIICTFVPLGLQNNTRIEIPRKKSDLGELSAPGSTLYRDNSVAQFTSAGAPAALDGAAAFLIDLSLRTYKFDAAGASTGSTTDPVAAANCTNGVATLGGAERCVTIPESLQGEYGDTSSSYSFFQVSVRPNPDVTAAQLATLWSEQLELQVCLKYRVGATVGEEERWRCPVWLSIPAQDLVVRAEVYMQMHSLTNARGLLQSLWDQTAGAAFQTFSGEEQPKPSDSFLSHSHYTTKLKKLQAGSTASWAKAYVRLSDIVVEERMTPTSVVDIATSLGGLETFFASCTLGMIALFSLLSAWTVKAKDSVQLAGVEVLRSRSPQATSHQNDQQHGSSDLDVEVGVAKEL